MPKSFRMLFALFVLTGAFPAQEPVAATLPVGSWLGTLDVGVKLRLVVHIEGEPGALRGKLDSPDQGAKGIAIDTLTFEGGVLKFTIDRLRASYEGRYDAAAAKFTGTFTQGRDLPLELVRTVGDVAPPKRPQQPSEPLPYAVEEVFYSHDPNGDTASSFAVADAATKPADRVRLAATLTLPKSKGPHPAVVLISGSGPQDRDETLLGHKPFLVLADALTRRGIAVLRFDDRGTAKSTGDHDTATTPDFAKDAYAGVLYLKTRQEVDGAKIGLIGHSEGGLIAPLVAAEHADIAFVVMLAGPGVDGAEIILLQSRLMAKAMGASDAVLEFNSATNRAVFDAVRVGGEPAAVRARVREALAASYDKVPDEARAEIGTRDEFIEKSSAGVLTPWFRFFLTYDPAPTLTKVKCPVLALNGSLDLQVDPGQNIPPIAKALADNPDATVRELEGLNHLFQNCTTGAVAEYSSIEETFDPATLELIGDWIAKRFL